MPKYYDTETAVKMRPTLEEDLRLKDGDPNALRLMSGGHYDGTEVAPWLLSDVFPIPAKKE